FKVLVTALEAFLHRQGMIMLVIEQRTQALNVFLLVLNTSFFFWNVGQIPDRPAFEQLFPGIVSLSTRSDAFEENIARCPARKLFADAPGHPVRFADVEEGVAVREAVNPWGVSARAIAAW